jgi:hypothetical protein
MKYPLVNVIMVLTSMSRAMDMLDTIPQEQIKVLSRQGVALLREDLHNNNPIRQMNIGCELAYSAYTNALNMIKQPLSSAEKEHYTHILHMYLNKCVMPHIEVYQEKLQNQTNTLVETRIFAKRIERLTCIQNNIEIALSTAHS